MAKVMAAEWRKLPVTLSELCLETTLRCGQSFRWKKLRGEEWYFPLAGVFRDYTDSKIGHAHYMDVFYHCDKITIV
jgi:N-glycosylase/DNA lyase